MAQTCNPRRSRQGRSFGACWTAGLQCLVSSKAVLKNKKDGRRLRNDTQGCPQISMQMLTLMYPECTHVYRYTHAQTMGPKWIKFKKYKVLNEIMRIENSHSFRPTPTLQVHCQDPIPQSTCSERLT